MHNRWYWRYLPALLWPIILATLSLELNMRSDWYAGYLFERLDVYEQVPDADQLHEAVYQTYFADASLAQTRFGKYEQLHFQDVGRLLSWNRYALLAACLGLLFFSFRFQQRFLWMRIGAIYVLAGLTAAVLLSTRWLLFFRGMHPLLFTHGHWDFHPNDLMLQLYPEMLLVIVASVMVLSILIMAVVLYWLGSRYDKEPLFADYRWEWKKKYTDAGFVVLLFCLPFWFTGKQMIEPWSSAWLLYWVICLVILLTCLLASSIKNTALSALIVGSAVVFLHLFAEGVSGATTYAQYVLDVSGKRYISYIEQHQAETGALPENIQALHAFAKEKKLKPLEQGFGYFGPWRYQKYDADEYIIYFKGPLAFEFSYHSATQYWNAMRNP